MGILTKVSAKPDTSYFAAPSSGVTWLQTSWTAGCLLTNTWICHRLFLKKLHAQDDNQLKTVRFSNHNGETLTKMFHWGLSDHVPKKLKVNGRFSLEIDENNVSDLYGRAQRVSLFNDTFTLRQVLDGFDLLSSGT